MTVLWGVMEKQPQFGKLFPYPTGHSGAVLTPELIRERSSGTQPSSMPGNAEGFPGAFGCSTSRGKRESVLLPAGERGAALGLGVAHPDSVRHCVSWGHGDGVRVRPAG